MGGGIVPFDRHAHRLDRERSTLWHRIPRVHRKVHQDLLELAGVGANAPRIVGEHHAQLQVITERAPQQPLEPGHDAC